MDWPQPTDAPRGVLGHRVRVGRFAAKAEADADAARLRAAGFSPVADWTPADGTPGMGLARVHVAVVDPAQFRGELAGSYGTALGSRETTGAMAADRGALLAVNAGYFVVDEGLGITGTLTGTSVYGGRLLNGASNGRAALVLPKDGLRPRIAELRTDLTVRSGSAAREIDGLNRKPGIIRNCGGVGGDSPTQRPLHDVTCTDPGEIVLLTPQLGVHAPTGEGTQVAREAMALDGGGSTTMVVGGEVVNSPSDATGERPVGDALLVLPGR